ncbi:MAG: hypothetical protein LBQ74_12930 [Prevotella sp.]|jgi:hypothetical protein|nr:hypothetical protein [Prevotella sp.]
MTSRIIQYLLTALTVSLITTAIYACTRKGMIFHSFANLIENKIVSLCKKIGLKMSISHNAGTSICKPLFNCMMCMSSFWGLTSWVILWFVYGHYFNPVLLIFLVCGINTIIASIVSNLFFMDDTE